MWLFVSTVYAPQKQNEQKYCIYIFTIKCLIEIFIIVANS